MQSPQDVAISRMEAHECFLDEMEFGIIDEWIATPFYCWGCGKKVLEVTHGDDVYFLQDDEFVSHCLTCGTEIE
jgi:hypothetical protein